MNVAQISDNYISAVLFLLFTLAGTSVAVWPPSTLLCHYLINLQLYYLSSIVLPDFSFSAKALTISTILHMVTSCISIELIL